ncbi:hypothetical protein ACQZ6C_07945 [Rhizobium rhizogenes]
MIYAFLYIVLSLIACYFSQILLRGTEDAKILEENYPQKSMWSDAIADFIFAVLLAVVVAKYASIWPANSFFATPIITAFIATLAGTLVLRLIEIAFLRKFIFFKMLARKTAYRVLILLATFLALSAFTVT